MRERVSRAARETKAPPPERFAPAKRAPAAAATSWVDRAFRELELKDHELASLTRKLWRALLGSVPRGSIAREVVLEVYGAVIDHDALPDLMTRLRLLQREASWGPEIAGISRRLDARLSPAFENVALDIPRRDGWMNVPIVLHDGHGDGREVRVRGELSAGRFNRIRAHVHGAQLPLTDRAVKELLARGRLMVDSAGTQLKIVQPSLLTRLFDHVPELVTFDGAHFRLLGRGDLAMGPVSFHPGEVATF